MKVGDIVFVGEPGPLSRKVTWRITSLHDNGAGATYATIRSGQTERSWVVPIERLTPYRLAEPA